MHRAILGGGKEMVADHINGDTLDNRRCNIRLCNVGQNCHNRKWNVRSGYKGVFANGKRWKAVIGFEGTKYYLGTYDTPLEAAHAYDEGAKKLYGEFAIVNRTKSQGE
jgi:hypothetical protein